MESIGVANVEHAPRISLNANGIAGEACGGTEIEASVIKVRNAPDVAARLGKMGDTRATRYRAGTGVISGQGQVHVAAVAFEKLLEMPYAGVDVLFGIEWILDFQLPSGRGHELHQSHCALAGDSIGIEVRFHLYDRAHQVRVDIVASSGHGN